MTYPASLLIHLASLETGETLGTADVYEVKETTKVYTQISCRFGQPRQTYPHEQISGDRVVRTPRCIVPVGTVASPGKRITGLTAPYTQTYIIKTVLPAYVGAGGSTLSHLVLDLENAT
jgi:hypothetical protein